MFACSGSASGERLIDEARGVQVEPVDDLLIAVWTMFNRREPPDTYDLEIQELWHIELDRLALDAYDAIARLAVVRKEHNDERDIRRLVTQRMLDLIRFVDDDENDITLPVVSSSRGLRAFSFR